MTHYLDENFSKLDLRIFYFQTANNRTNIYMQKIIFLRVFKDWFCCIRCGPDEERILAVVPREDGARNSG